MAGLEGERSTALPSSSTTFSEPRPPLSAGNPHAGAGCYAANIYQSCRAGEPSKNGSNNDKQDINRATCLTRRSSMQKAKLVSSRCTLWSSRSRSRCAADILVNNAGISHIAPTIDTDLDDARHLFETNVWGALATTQEVA